MDALVLWLLSLLTTYSVPPTECRRHPGPQAQMVYLHATMNTNSGFGIDLEDQNRLTLEQVAAKCQLSVALPVSDYKTGNQVRWYGKSQKTSEEKAKMAESEIIWAIQDCLVKDTTLPLVVLGFSDGGYTVNHLEKSGGWSGSFSNYFASGTGDLQNPNVVQVPQQANAHLLDETQLISAFKDAGICH